MASMLIPISGLLFVGLYALLGYLLGVKGSFKVKRRLRKYHEKESVGNAIERLAAPLAHFISKMINLPQYKHDSLFRDLRRAGLPYTPQVYYGMAIAKGLIIASLAVPLFVLGMHTPAIGSMLIGFAYGMKERDVIKEKLKELNAAILDALPSFVRSVTESLKTDKNFQRIFEKYLENVPGTPLKNDLNKLIARLGANQNKESALREFETALNNEQLRSFVNALIEVSRDGADQKYYFDAANQQMTILNRENIKRSVAKRPKKIKRATLAMALCAILVMVYPVVMQLVQGLKAFQ